MAKSASSPAIIVLAAGQGTRMRSSLPKVLHKVAGEPMLTQVLKVASQLRPASLTLVTSPGANALQEAAAKVAPRCRFAVQKVARGTGDAVRAALPSLGKHNGPVMVLYADTPLITADTLRRLLAGLTRQKAALAVLAMEPKDPGQYGRLVLGRHGDVECIVEYRDATPIQRKELTVCNSGVMAFQAKALRAMLPKLKPDNAKGEYYLTDLVALARAAKLRTACVHAGEEEVLGVNSRAELAQAETIMQQRLRAQAMENGVTLIDPSTTFLSMDTQLAADVTVHPYVVFGPGVAVETGATIRPFCHLEGAHVGAGSIVGPFARLRPGALLDENVHVGNFVEVKNSALRAGAKANHLSYIGDAQVGERANIGAGTITCNYDGVNKHKTAIGPDAFIGSNTALVAPVTVGARATVGAGSVITADVPPDALSLARGQQVNKPGRAKARRKPKPKAK